MFVITTRNFPPELGGMQILMSDIAKNLVEHGPVKVYAEEHKGAENYDEKQAFEIQRIKGFKFVRKLKL